MSIPEYDTNEVFQLCVNSISDEGLRARLCAVSDHISELATDYNQKAQTQELFQIQPFNSGNDSIVIGSVTKRELKKVYTHYMVGRSKPARTIYDELLAGAPRGKCPLCGFGQASTLDHYLPKAKFPCLSVLPINLLPSCKDCNTGKSAAIAEVAGNQCLHPYFDHQEYIFDQWLIADVEQSSPVSIRYFVDPPIHWQNVSKERVKAHFKSFKLAHRFSIEATNELASLRDVLSQYCQRLGADGVRQHLNIEASANFNRHKNSWQTAMYQALAASDWYCNGGFNEG